MINYIFYKVIIFLQPFLSKKKEVNVNNNSKFITAKEASKMLGIHRDTVYRMAKVGKLPHYRIGAGSGCVRFNKQDINDYISKTKRG